VLGVWGRKRREKGVGVGLGVGRRRRGVGRVRGFSSKKEEEGEAIIREKEGGR